MVPINTIIQDTLQVLRDSAWQGAGVIVSSTLSLVALHYARQPHTHNIPSFSASKEKNVQVWDAIDGRQMKTFTPFKKM